MNDQEKRMFYGVLISCCVGLIISSIMVYSMYSEKREYDQRDRIFNGYISKTELVSRGGETKYRIEYNLNGGSDWMEKRSLQTLGKVGDSVALFSADHERIIGVVSIATSSRNRGWAIGIQIFFVIGIIACWRFPELISKLTGTLGTFG